MLPIGLGGAAAFLGAGLGAAFLGAALGAAFLATTWNETRTGGHGKDTTHTYTGAKSDVRDAGQKCKRVRRRNEQ